MDQKRSKNQKRIVSGLLSLAMITTSMSAVLPASADSASKQEAYPYAIFAADEQGGIKLDLNYLTVNGNACTNGVYSTTAKYPNVNGTIFENEALAVDDVVTDDENTTDAQDSAKAFDVSRDMIYIHNKLMTSWFNNGRNFDDDYTLSEMNINLNSPVYVTGRMSYNGNMALNTAIGAVSDVTLSGGNLNGNNAVIYSKFGDIKIDDSQASMNGLIYAPFGTVTIDCDNFNLNGLIIAQNVVINSRYGANINYSNTWAEFVGIETEELSWTFADWKYLADTDKDGLPNIIEKEIGTKPYEADTDGDLLPDGYEVLSLGTDPLKIDTDNNGVSDYDEDYDEDGLSNGREYEIGTRPYADDTDGDNLKDGEEVDKYFTDPLEMDTDKDGLDDDDEIYFGTDSKDPDTDDDGELDGKERRSQTFTHKVESEDCAVTEVIVSMEGTGNLQKTTTVESVMNKDMLCTGVVGLVGEPFSIETTSEYEKATLTYVIDKSKLGDTEFDNLLFLWYDEKKNEFVELDTILDEENSTVSINTTHFSKYMIVDREAWFDNWRKIYAKFESLSSDVPSVTAICVDCSGSMSTNDPSTEFEDGSEGCYRELAVTNYIKSMMPFDRTCIITFNHEANTSCPFISNKLILISNALFFNSGGTNADAAIEIALTDLSKEKGNKNIILLSDGDVNVKDTRITSAAQNSIRIHTIGLGKGADNEALKKCSRLTGGEHFTATTAKKLEEIYSDLSDTNKFDFSYSDDKDGDGVPDDIEIYGIPMPNGELVFTDPNEKHSDKDIAHPTGDGLTDGEEVGTLVRQRASWYTPEEYVKYKFVFNVTSDPTKMDSDDDGILDNYDLKSFNAFDHLFELANYNDTQPIDLFPIGLQKQLDELHKLHGFEFPTTINKFEDMTFWDSLTSNELSLDVIRLAAVTANFSKLPAKVISGYSGYMPNASKFLLHFCGNSGTDLYYDADEPIACTAIGRELFNRTMNRLIDEAEDTIADGATVCFATRADRSLYNKNEIKFLEADFYQFRNSMEFDWSYSIGKGTTGIIAEITRNGCEYSMKFKYCIFDLYDWEKDDEGGLYYLNCKGKAMCYKSIGVYEDSFTWISGNRFLTLTDKSSDSVKPLNSIYEYEYLQQWMLSLDHIENFYTWRRYLHPEEF